MNIKLTLAITGLTVFQAFPQMPVTIRDCSVLHKKNFKQWEVIDHEFRGMVGDGGSFAFTFSTRKHGEFGLLVAHPGYWTEDEINQQTQGFFIFFMEDSSEKEDASGETANLPIFKVKPKSQEEEILLTLLSETTQHFGANPKKLELLEKLIAHIKSRKAFTPSSDDLRQ